MKTVQLVFGLLILPFLINAQNIFKKIDNAVKQLEADSQMKHAIMSLYVVNSKTGTVVYGKNSQAGLTAASSQKVITSIATLELLSTDYRYKTELGYDGKIENGVLNGNLYINGNGDPTLGSWRYTNTKEEVVLKKWLDAVKNAGIKTVTGNLVAGDQNFESQTIPGGWTWDDIGNYYGAGVSALNWRENQYDLNLKPGGKTGDKVSISSTTPYLYQVQLSSELTTAAKGSGDNTVIYLPPGASAGVIRGTIPLGQDSFTVSGSFSNPKLQLLFTVADYFKKSGITAEPDPLTLNTQLSMVNAQPSTINAQPSTLKIQPTTVNQQLSTIFSPPLDSINYWFLKKSVNLYGEVFVKTLALQTTGFGSTKGGLEVIKDFWKERGIDPASLNMFDGSGLSPKNRITTNALVTALQYVATKPWFISFYNALPDINGLKMKSGSMGGVRSFTGYSKSRDGQQYTFAIILNNFSGPSTAIVAKMYKVLDTLK